MRRTGAIFRAFAFFSALLPVFLFIGCCPINSCTIFVIQSEAKNLVSDCFGTSSLAMTVYRSVRDRTLAGNVSAISDMKAAVLPCRTPDTPRLFEGLRPGSGLTAGKFLVASKKLNDPMFRETVVLLLSYDQNGAMGVIINRSMDIKLSNTFPDIEELQGMSDSVYVGGPVAAHQMLLLIRSGVQPENSPRVFDNVYVSSSLALFKRVLAGLKKEERFRIYAGYSGWAPGQLEQEISRGDWHIFRADEATVFDKPSQEIWPEFIKRISALEVRMRRTVHHCN